MVAFEFHRPVVVPIERMAGAGFLCKSDLDDVRRTGLAPEPELERSWARMRNWRCLYAESVSG